MAESHLRERPIDPAGFRAIGFQRLSVLDDLLPTLKLLVGTPEVRSFENARVVPWFAPGPNASRTVPGIWSDDGEPLTDPGRKPGIMPGIAAPNDQVEAGPIESIDHGVYLGWLQQGFGHLITESLSRVWHRPTVVAGDRLLFHARVGRTPPKSAFPTLALAGVRHGNCSMIPRPMLVRHLRIPDELFRIQESVHVDFAAVHQSIADDLCRHVELTEQPLYLSRSRLPVSSRLIAGEVAFEAALEASGVRVIAPETMSLAEQVRAVNQHKLIIAAMGSAAHLVLFARQQPRLVILSGEEIHPNYVLVSAAAASPTTFARALTIRKSSKNWWTSQFSIDPVAVVRHLAEVGVAIESAAANRFLASRDPDRETEDNRWGLFYGASMRYGPDWSAQNPTAGVADHPESWWLPWVRLTFDHLSDARDIASEVDAFIDRLSRETDAIRIQRFSPLIAKGFGRVAARLTPEQTAGVRVACLAAGITLRMPTR